MPAKMPATTPAMPAGAMPSRHVTSTPLRYTSPARIAD
jgi:hypothetical protein